MGRPVVLSDNLFNPRIYPDHVLDASSTATNTHALYLSSGRRIRDLTGWQASALNTIGWVESTFDQLRAFDLLWIDRDHNLAGESVYVVLSDDDFATIQTIGPKTVPTDPVPMSRLYDGEIVMTDEGALLWYLELQATYAVRVYVAAMGAGLRPEMAGLAVGKLWTPESAAIKPNVLPRTNLTYTAERSTLGQDASSEFGCYRSQELRLRMASWEEYATALYPVESLFLKRRPTVVIPDDEQAERAVLTRVAPGAVGFEVPQNQFLPEITIPWEESQPELVN